MVRRVVVTGLGTVNPLGNDIAAFWEGIKAGRSGVGKITRFETDGLPVKIAAEVKEFKSDDFIENGGIINFKLKDARVRIEIDAAAAERARLHISSKLLSLAEIRK